MRTIKFTFLLLVITGLLSCVAPQCVNNPVPGPSPQGRYVPWHDDGVLISVHRTMGPLAAENSIEAIRECYLAGGDAIDCDLRFTQDGVLVTIHDRAPIGNRSKVIRKLPWAEVCQLDLEPNEYPGQKVPRFEDVVRHALANNMAIYLDAKEEGTREAAQAILKRYDALHLIQWPRFPRVYSYKEKQDNNAAYLRKLFGDVERGKVKVKAGEPRHFRCNDPRTIAALAGRTQDVITRVRGPYRKPVPER